MKTNADIRREHFARLKDEIGKWFEHVDANEFGYAEADWAAVEGFKRMVEMHTLRGVMYRDFEPDLMGVTHGTR